ncbi:MAG: hypothetical protein QOE61_2189 [Micromonosporaceae bacterium]|nr:hypothetical protein [Micromonosporaceae bacterium]
MATAHRRGRTRNRTRAFPVQSSMCRQPRTRMVALAMLLALAGCADTSPKTTPTIEATTATTAIPTTAAPTTTQPTTTQPSTTQPSAKPTAAEGSGMQGRTTIDGGCPVIRAGTPCPDRPLSARITVTRTGSDTVITTITSDADGEFRIPLPPGTYLLRPDNLAGARYPAAQPTTITVRSGQFTQVTIAFDSGIQ